MWFNQPEPSPGSKEQLRIPRLRTALSATLALLVIAAVAWITWVKATPQVTVRPSARQEEPALSPLFKDPATVRDLQNKYAAEPNKREWLDRLAVAYVQEEQYLSAVEVLTRIVQQPGPQPDARRGLIHCYNQVECYASALPHVLALVKQEPQALEARLGLADQYRRLGDRQRGAKILDEIPRNAAGYPTLKSSKGRASDLERIAMGYGDLGEWEKCFLLARRLVADNPSRLSAHLGLGRALFSLGRMREAVPELTRGLGASPDDPDLQLLLASALRAAGRPEDRRALKLLLLRVSSGKEAPGWSWYELGRVYRQEQDWNNAAQCFRSAYDQRWERAPSLQYLGEALGKMGRVEESLYRTGLYYEAMGQPEKALAEYRKLSDLHQNDVYGSLHVARAYGLMGQHRQQESVLLSAWKQDRSEPGLLGDLARCYESLKEFDKEKQSWEQYLQADPSHAEEAYQHLGALADVRGQLDEAERLYRKCIELAPDSAPNKLQLARLLLARRAAPEKLAEAIRLLEDAIRLSRDSSALFSQLGLAYMYAQRKEEAILALRHAIDLEPANGKPYFQLSQLLMQTGQREEAEWAQSMHRRYRDSREKETILLERLHRAPNDVSTHSQLAALYEAMDAPEQAIREYEAILAIQLNHPEARRHLLYLYATLARYDKQASLLRED